MWWLFEIKETNNDIIQYRYSRESEKLDGEIIYNKRKKTAILRPCSLDTESEWNQSKALDKFMSFVVGEKFPSKRRVVIG